MRPRVRRLQSRLRWRLRSRGISSDTSVATVVEADYDPYGTPIERTHFGNEAIGSFRCQICDLPPFRGRKLPRRRDAHLASESFLGLPGPDERRETVRHVLDLISKRRNLRSIRTTQILQVRCVTSHLVQHVLDRLRLAAGHPEGPLELFLRLRRQLVQAV